MKEVPPLPEYSTLFDIKANRDVRIGVALDEAFNFYYADLFDILHAAGADSVPFSPVHDRLPVADGYIIGGGYPGIFCQRGWKQTTGCGKPSGKFRETVYRCTGSAGDSCISPII